jgi:hypothetical protein
MPDIGSFDASQHEPAQAFDPLPAGWWAIVTVKQEVRDTKDRSGKFLWVEFQVDETRHPEHKGRKVWERFNLWNSNPEAVAIAQREFSGLCRAAGKMQVTDSDVLNGIPVAAKLKVRNDPGYEPSNTISAFDSVAARFPAGGAPPPSSAPAAAAAPAATPPATGQAPASASPPWQR